MQEARGRSCGDVRLPRNAQRREKNGPFGVQRGEAVCPRGRDEDERHESNANAAVSLGTRGRSIPQRAWKTAKDNLTKLQPQHNSQVT